MQMRDRRSHCQRRARQTKSDYPGLCYTKRLDIAAQEQAFSEFKHLKRIHDRIGEDGIPSRLAIVLAGGNANESPLRPVDSEVTIS